VAWRSVQDCGGGGFVTSVWCSCGLSYAGIVSVSRRITCTAAARHSMVVVVVADEVAGAA
jgi:hypothetical protein